MDDIANIIDGCRKQDRLSQEKLYRQFYPALFALCKTFLENNEDVLTALNNGMLRVYRNIERYDPAKGSFFNWMYTIVRNAALSMVRNNKTTPSTEMLTEDMAEKASFNPFLSLEWEGIYLLLKKLPRTTRAVCSMYYMEGFTIKEISASLEIKEGTVKWHLNESRQRLKITAHSNLKKSE